MHEALSLEIVNLPEDQEDYFGFYWTLKKFEADLMEIQITFENPLYISSYGKSEF